jgi:hypothetical protein
VQKKRHALGAARPALAIRSTADDIARSTAIAVAQLRVSHTDGTTERVALPR